MGVGLLFASYRSDMNGVSASVLQFVPLCLLLLLGRGAEAFAGFRRPLFRYGYYKSCMARQNDNNNDALCPLLEAPENPEATFEAAMG